MNKYEKIFNKEDGEIDYQYELKKANFDIHLDFINFKK